MNSNWILPCSLLLGSFFVVKGSLAQEQAPPIDLSLVNSPVGTKQPIIVPETSLAGGCGTNIIINGDFETNTATGCDFNLSNAAFNAKVGNATAFGTAQEIDVMRDPAGCGHALPPFSGTTKLAISRQGVGGPFDAFSFGLSMPIVAGQRYHLQFFGAADPDFPFGDVEVGISTSATDFGTRIATGSPGVGLWTRFDFDFFAPVSGSFLTVREGESAGWSHIDAFSLVPLCCETNLILNGDFETNQAFGCDFNLSNARFDSEIWNVYAFGEAQETDLLKDPAGCGFGLPPFSGTTKVAIHRLFPGGPTDELAFDLRVPVMAGQKYHLQFFAVADVSFTPETGAVEVGLSSSNSDFGTLIATAFPGLGSWTQFDLDFVAPITASFLTIREGDFNAWSHIDAFSLVRVCDATASWSNYGAGWPGTNGIVPSFTSSADPKMGGSFRLDLANSRGAATQGVLFLGLAAADLPSSYGGHLLVLPASVILLMIPGAGASLPGSVPCDAALCGASVYLQVWETDPGASKGVSATRGLKLVLGS